MSSDKRYFNFPIKLLSGFLLNRDLCLDHILFFSLYDHAMNKLTYGGINKRLIDTASYYKVTLGYGESIRGFRKWHYDVNTLREEGERLYGLYGLEKVKVGISTEIFWDFKNNPKTTFDDVCLLAFLALRSILRDKPFCRITNLYWLSRMDGNTHRFDNLSKLSDEVKKYANEYQLKKIKYYLTDGWNLVHYGRYTRGFYISFKLELHQLAYQVEKKRKLLKMRQQKEAQKRAYRMALEKLRNDY